MIYFIELLSELSSIKFISTFSPLKQNTVIQFFRISMWAADFYAFLISSKDEIFQENTGPTFNPSKLFKTAKENIEILPNFPVINGKFDVSKTYGNVIFHIIKRLTEKPFSSTPATYSHLSVFSVELVSEFHFRNKHTKTCLVTTDVCLTEEARMPFEDDG